MHVAKIKKIDNSECWQERGVARPRSVNSLATWEDRAAGAAEAQCCPANSPIPRMCSRERHTEASRGAYTGTRGAATTAGGMNTSSVRTVKCCRAGLLGLGAAGAGPDHSPLGVSWALEGVSSVPGFHPLHASSTPPVVTTENGPMSPGEESPLLRSSAREQCGGGGQCCQQAHGKISEMRGAKEARPRRGARQRVVPCA